MPNRIIKESICTSENLNNLTPPEEIFFYRLIVNCDDYGRMDARPPVLRSRCFPLRLDTISDTDTERWLQTLVENKLIYIYSVNGLQYIQMATWDKHQQVRAKRSKYPDPKSSDSNGKQLIASDSNGKQLIANVPVIQSESLSLSLSESNPNPNPNPNPKASTPTFETYKSKLAERYPELQIEDEWERCQIWYRDHKKKIKSPSLALGNWCKKETEIKAQEGKGNARTGTNRGDVQAKTSGKDPMRGVEIIE